MSSRNSVEPEPTPPQGSSQVHTFETFNADDLNPLIVPSGCEKKTYTSFGLGGMTAIISPYGAILNISKSIIETKATAETKSTIESKSTDNKKLRILSLDCQSVANCSRTGMERRQRFQQLAERQTPENIGLGLFINSSNSDINPVLSWLNDRWPRITYSLGGIDVSVQFAVQKENILLQQYLLTNNTDEDKDLPFLLNTLFIKLSNNGPDDLDVYTAPLGFDACPVKWDVDHCLIHIEGSKNTAEAMIYVFHNGTIMNFKMNSCPIPWRTFDSMFEPSLRRIFSVPKGSVQEVTVAYKIQQKDEVEISTLDYIDTCSFLKNDHPRNMFFEENNKFSPIFRRQLEYILCACSLPFAGTSEEEQYIAFTNGNVLYPFFAPPLCAFFMFRYLLLVYRLLERKEINDSYTQERIRITCKRHLAWCFKQESFPNPETDPHAEDSPNHKVQDIDNMPNFAIGSLQILKLFEYFKVFGKEGQFVTICLKQCGEKWIQGLSTERDEKSKLWYQRNNTPTYIAWEGSRENPPEWLRIPSFRLGDSIYLWKALKSLQELASRASKELNNSAQGLLDELKTLDLMHHDVRKLIIRRFICAIPSGRVNDAEDVRPQQDVTYAVAVSRSGSREADRFLFYAKDTLLYDGLQWGFFKNDSDIDIQSAWRETVKSQGIDEEVIWQTPLRYGLAIIMETLMLDFGAKLDKSMAPDALAKLARERLSKCTFSSGLIAERIDWNTKQPILETDYCNSRSTFEIPTLLLRKEYDQTDFRLLPSEDIIADIRHETLVAPTTDIKLEDEDQKRRRIASVKKNIAFEKRKKISNASIDKTQVFDLEERKKRDWLHPFPDFISRRPPYEDTSEEINLLRRLVQSYPFKILDKGIASWENEPRAEMFSYGPFYPYTCLVVDIAKHGRERPIRGVFDSDDLDRFVRNGRTVEEAKKRFFYLSPLSTEHALVLYLAAPKRERYNMVEFLSRHGNFNAHLREDVHHVANVWTTELHLAFIQLAPAQDKKYTSSDNRPLLDGFVSKFPFKIANQRVNAFKVSLSYRVNGDMDDRYWTAYLLAYLPKQSPSWPKLTENEQVWFEPSSQQDQRKILEPYLVHRMASEAYNCTRELLEAIEIWVELKNSMDGGFDRLYTRSKVCLDIDGVLNQTRRMLQANISNLDAWLRREESRSVQPRWSEKDELKHGDWRDHHNLRVRQQVNLLKDQSEKIDATINQLVDNLNLAETRTAARSAENVRIFTYATVIFLPLSFVSSLFSMQGAPAESVLAAFGRVTAVALVITLIVVFNAETLAWPIMLIRFKISEGARKRMRETSSKWPLEWRKAAKVMTKLEDDSVLRNDEAPRWPGNKIVYLFYWLVYLLVEFPATRIVLGGRSFISLWQLKQDSRSVSNILRLIARIGVGLLLIPVFLITWPLLALWAVVVGTLSAVYQRIKQSLAKAQGRTKAKKVWAALGDAKLDGDEVPEEGHENNEENKTESKKAGLSAKQRAEEKVRKSERWEKQKLQECTSLLVNPPELLDLKNIKVAFADADKSEDESTEEHQEEEEEEEEEDEPEGDGKSTVESAYSEYLDKLKNQRAEEKAAAGEKHRTTFWEKIKSVFKRRKTTGALDVEP